MPFYTGRGCPLVLGRKRLFCVCAGVLATGLAAGSSWHAHVAQKHGDDKIVLFCISKKK